MPLPTHVQWLATHRGPELERVLQAQGHRHGVLHAMGVLADADPSPGLHGVQWLFDTLCRGGMRWEDVSSGARSRARETLELFAQHRRALPLGSRKLEGYLGLGGVWTALMPLLAPSETAEEPENRSAGEGELEPTGRAARRAAREQAREQSSILCNRPDLLVAVPHTQASATWWGRGTRWCTAARDDNMFEDYNSRGPLVVVVLEGGTKLQLHLDSDGGLQFMDATDSDVDSALVEEHWQQLGPLLSWAASRGADVGELVPSSLWDDTIGPAIMARDGMRLSILPEEGRTHAICSAAVSNTAHAMAHVPMNLRDAALYQCAVAANGLALSWIADTARSPELCMLAVTGNGSALQHVPRHRRSPQIIAAAVQSNGMALDIVDPRDRTPDICRAAIKQNGMAIAWVPRDLWTPELLLEAVRSNAYCLKEIAQEWWTPELLLAAVEQNGMAIRYVAASPFVLEACWENVCTTAMRNNPSSLCYIPKNLRTREICIAAVGVSGDVVGFVPSHLQDDMMYALAVESSPSALQWIPREFLTRDILLSALGRDGDCLQYVLQRLELARLDHDVVEAAIRQHPWAIQYIDLEEQTPELCTIAVKGNPATMLCINPDVMTHEMCVHALSRDANIVDYVREDLRADVLAAVALCEDQAQPESEPEWDRAMLDELADCLRMAGPRAIDAEVESTRPR